MDEEIQGGEVVFAGNANWSLAGRGGKTSKFDGVEDATLWAFHRLKPLQGVCITQVISGPVATHCVAISTAGECFTWGRNETGQLGLGHLNNVYNPQRVTISGKKSIVGGSCGNSHTLVFDEQGRMYGAGAAKCGQLGLLKAVDQVKSFSESQLSGVVSTGCGRDFSVAVDRQGYVYSFGHPEYGQLGHGTEGKTLERANKFTFAYVKTPKQIEGFAKFGNPKVVDVSCGANHTAAMDEEGRVYCWGYGAYGRLGLKDNKNRMEPEAVEVFSHEPPPPDPSLPKFMQRQVPKVRAQRISCGSSSTFAVARQPYFSLYMWGITKKSGEANMYPVQVQNVSGWKVRSVASGNSSVAVASERSLITWGSSPTFGELGLGDPEKGNPKSSTVSKEVKDLKGAFVEMVACGYSHTLAIVRLDGAGKKLIEKLPVFAPKEPTPKKKKSAAKQAGADEDEEEQEEEGEEEEEEEKPKRKRRKKK